MNKVNTYAQDGVSFKITTYRDPKTDVVHFRVRARDIAEPSKELTLPIYKVDENEYDFEKEDYYP